MAAVDGLSLDAGNGGTNWKRWALAGAAAFALHAGIIAVISRTPPDAAEFGENPAIEMDLTPPPSGEAQLQEAGANANQAEQPEQLEEVQDDQTPPEEQPDAVEAAPVEDVQEAQPIETPEVAADDVKTPDDVQAAVSLPPERTVVAQEERPPEPKKEPVKEPPVVRKPPPKREPPKEAKPADKPVERPRMVATQAGGQSGASSASGAASAAAASNYGSRVRAAVAAQKRAGTILVGRATVTFTLNRSGRVGAVSASGPPAVAAEAVAMVRRASFPPMPPEMQGASKAYTLPVSFSTR